MSDQNVVKMEDGTSVNFGNRTRLISEQTILETGFELVFSVINGVVLKYVYSQEAEMPMLVAEMAAFGAAKKAKDATAGCKTPEEVAKVISDKIAEFSNNVFITRGAANLSLSLHQEAYANMESLDKSKIEDVLKIKEHFEGLSKEDRSTLIKSAKFRIAVSQIRLAQAQAELAEEAA